MGIYLLISLIISLFLIFVNFSIPISAADNKSTAMKNAQLTTENNDSRIFYGCEDHNEGIFHCNRLHNKFNSFAIDSKSTVLYNATDIPMYVPGIDKLALQMYGNHLKSITFSNTSSSLPQQFSIAFWIKGVPLPDKPRAPTVGHIASQFNGAHTGGWSFVTVTPYLQNFTKESTRFTVYNSRGEAFSSQEVPIYRNNTFTHIVGTFDGTFIKIYKDGVFVGETKFNGTFNNNINIPLTLGVSSANPMLFYWTGNIDDLRYYNKALSINEIKQIFSDPNSIVAPTNLIGNWKFDRNLDDSSGNNHTGTERTLISSMVFAPDGRLFFSEKDTGNIRIMENGKVKTKPFATIGDYHSNWEQGLLGLALDPDFKDNHFVYQFYTTIDIDTKKAFNRIVRFTDVNNQGKNESIIFDRIPASNGLHSGGAMAFGPDNKLYVTVGDATKNIKCGNLPNSTGNICPAQDPTSLLGKVLRMNPDGTIPEDNPYRGSPVYNIGHRNMYGIAFGKGGFGLVSENGANLYDEINTLEKDENYGSPTLQPANTDPELWQNYTKPLRSYYESYCLTQMIYYDGNKIANLKDKFLVAALGGSNTIHALEVDFTNKKIIGEEEISLGNFLNNEVVALAQSPSGHIYYGAYAISKLDSINNNHRSQLVFPIEIRYSPHVVKINELSFSSSNNELIADIETLVHVDNTTNHKSNPDVSFIPSHSDLKIKIPKGLLDQIKSIKLIDKKGDQNEYANQNVSFNVENSPKSDYIVLDIFINQTGKFGLLIGGKSD